jgi:hypothetical protein
MSLRIRIHIRMMVDTRARMFRLPSDGVGEATAITTTPDISTAFAMAGTRGIHGGGGERLPVVKKL